MPQKEADAAAELALDFEQREIVLRADFDDVDDEGCLWVSLRFLRGPRPPRPGEAVYLLDLQGRACLARVRRVIGWLACVAPNPEAEESRQSSS